MRQETGRWALLLGVALAIHAVAFFVWQWTAVPMIAMDAGGGGVRIALAPAVSISEDQSETEATDTNEPAPPVVERILLPVVEPVEVAPIEPVLPVVKERVEEVDRQREPLSETASVSVPANIVSSTANDSTGNASGDAGVAQANAEADYRARLIDWLSRHKRYPKAARRRGMEGIAELTMTLTRQGELLDYSVSRSTGYHILDREVREMLRRAAPLPALPAHMTAETWNLTLPVRFELTGR